MTPQGDIAESPVGIEVPIPPPRSTVVKMPCFFLLQMVLEIMPLLPTSSQWHTVTYYIPGTDVTSVWIEISIRSWAIHRSKRWQSDFFQESSTKLLTSKAAETYLALLAEYPWWMESFSKWIPKSWLSWKSPPITARYRINSLHWGRWLEEKVRSDGNGHSWQIFFWAYWKKLMRYWAGTGLNDEIADLLLLVGFRPKEGRIFHQNFVGMATIARIAKE